jgi:hypothetical protein
MRPTEIRAFANRFIRHLEFCPCDIQMHSYGQEWSDTPFKDAKYLKFETFEIFASRSIIPATKISSTGWCEFRMPLRPNSTWTDLLLQIDNFLRLVGDRHHTALHMIEDMGEYLEIHTDS